MTTGKVRVGVLGLGAIAQVVHLPVLSDIEDIELVAVCDADRAKAKAIAARFGIPHVFQSDEEVFRSDEVDAIVICTPSHLHEPQAIAALEGGKHVLVEKPMALSADACARVVAAADRAGRVLLVAFNNRFGPDAVALKPFIEGGELGDVFLARGAWLNRKVRVVRPTWRHRLATAGGGAMMDLGVQTLDLAMWLLGFPAVKSICTHFHYSEGMEVEDSAAIVARLVNGGGITLTVSWSLVADRDRHYMRLLGSKGSGAIAPLGVFKEVEHGLLDVTPSLPSGRENVYNASYRAELSQFASACRGDIRQEPPREQIELMRVVALAYQSAREGREIEAS
jgi:predicted dehydrogenase